MIDQQGRDLKPGLYGKVKQDGDIFVGERLDGKTAYWDAKGGRMYDMMPQFERIDRFEVAKWLSGGLHLCGESGCAGLSVW